MGGRHSARAGRSLTLAVPGGIEGLGGRAGELAYEARGSYRGGCGPEGRGEVRAGIRFQGHLAPAALKAADALKAGKDESSRQRDQGDADQFEPK